MLRSFSCDLQIMGRLLYTVGHQKIVLRPLRLKIARVMGHKDPLLLLSSSLHSEKKLEDAISDKKFFWKREVRQYQQKRGDSHSLLMFKSVQKRSIQAMPKKCQTKITMDVIIIFSLHENNVHGMYKKRVFFYASGASYINFLIKKNRIVSLEFWN